MKMLRSRWLTHAGLLVSSILAALILCEVLLRVSGVSYPVFDDYDEARGVRLRPGKQGWYRAEGEAHLSINSLGYRDREHDHTKPESTFRIAVLGDSYVEARQVPLEKTFWYRLGLHLEACQFLNGEQVEMFSFGIGGYNTSQEYLTLQKDVQAFSPDLVLLAMFLGNDIEGNSSTLQNGSAWRMPAPTHRLVDGEFVLDDSFNRSVSRRLLYEMVHRSRVFELVNEARRALRAQAWQSSDLNHVELGLSSDIYIQPEPPEWREAWQVTKALLGKMNDLTRGMGARFVVTTIPRAIEVDPTGDRRERFEASIGVDDLLHPDERLARMGADLGFPIYPLTKELQVIAEAHGVYMHGFANTQLGLGHLNEDGHRLVAELLATKLCNPADLGRSPDDGFLRDDGAQSVDARLTPTQQ
jgi:hypothetical protein